MPPGKAQGNSPTNILVDGLIERLFASEMKRIKRTTLDIIKENNSLYNGEVDGFMYLGRYYTDLDPKLISKGTKKTISIHLVPRMQFHLKDINAIEMDKRLIKQALTLVLMNARSLQDIRDALPNGLAEMIDQCKNLPRKREEAFTLDHNEQLKAQYFKLRQKPEFYLATRLLY